MPSYLVVWFIRPGRRVAVWGFFEVSSSSEGDGASKLQTAHEREEKGMGKGFAQTCVPFEEWK